MLTGPEMVVFQCWVISFFLNGHVMSITSNFVKGVVFDCYCSFCVGGFSIREHQ